MTRRRLREQRRKSNTEASRVRTKRGVTIAIPLVVIGVLAVGAWLLLQRRPASAATPEDVRAEIIPQAGDQTAYGRPLSLENTQQFIDYYETCSLTAAEERMLDDALRPLKAPCCDDNPMSTCCCDCNLAKSVWGLSSYLITEQGFGAEDVQASALQWLRFIHGDYYVGQELAERGVNPARYGMPQGDSCYTGRCELPFAEAGCGGMAVLKQ